MLGTKINNRRQWKRVNSAGCVDYDCINSEMERIILTRGLKTKYLDLTENIYNHLPVLITLLHNSCECEGEGIV